MDQISVPPTRDSAGLAVSSLDRLALPVLSILRIMAALLFIEHGLAKFFGFPVRTMEAPALFDLEWFDAAIEFDGGVLLALGLFTRAVALIASGEMAIGYFLFHAPQGCYPYVTTANWRSCTASFFSIWCSPAPDRGASTLCCGASASKHDPKKVEAGFSKNDAPRILF
jgi:putative oxidoreductase